MFNILACFAELVNEHGGADVTATQYFLDTGQVARRGFCWKGMHLWETCPSKGMEHFVKGAVPKDFGRTRPPYGLYEAKDCYPVDDLKLGMLNPEKPLSQYKWTAPGKISTEDLKKINWSKRVIGYTDGKASAVINYDGLTVASKEGVPEQGIAVGFFLTPCVSQLILNADVINVEWISNSQAVVAFSHSSYGGVISCWYLAARPGSKEQREIIDVYFNNQTIQYKRFNNKLEKITNVNIPEIPKTNKKAEVIEEAPQPEVTTVEKIEPEEVEKPMTAAKAAEQAKEAPEKVSENVGNPPAENLENVIEPTIDDVFEDILRQLSEIPNNPLDGVVKDLKFLAKTVTGLRKRVSKELKHAADSAELKTLQQENKDLQKRVNALQATVKAQAELLQKQL